MRATQKKVAKRRVPKKRAKKAAKRKVVRKKRPARKATKPAFKHWAKKESWSLEEAAALLLQRRPSVTNIKSLGLEELRLLEGPVGISHANVPWDSKHSEEFAMLLARMVDAVMAGTLKSNNMNVTPADFVSWAGTRGLIKGPPTRALVKAVGIDNLYGQVSNPYEAVNQLSLSDAADYLSSGLKDSYTTDRLINLGLEHKIGIAVLTDVSGIADSGVRYIHTSDLEKFKSYAFSPPVRFRREWKYLEDALVGPEHFRYYFSHSHQPKTVNSLSELFTTREQLDRYISQVLAESKKPNQGDTEHPKLSANAAYWETVVRPVYNDVKSENPTIDFERQIAKIVEKRLIKNDVPPIPGYLKPPDFDTIRNVPISRAGNKSPHLFSPHFFAPPHRPLITWLSPVSKLFDRPRFAPRK